MDSLLGGVFVIAFARAIFSPVCDQIGYNFERRRLRKAAEVSASTEAPKGSQIAM